MQTKLIDPKTLAAIKDLSLGARMVVSGFMAGLHTSLKRGAGLEFSQYRSYQPGDDLRQLDWKMFARSDRYYIRESETDTNLRVQFILDGSNSMLHQDGAVTKFAYAKILIACLGYLATQQSDEISLYILQENNLRAVLPTSNAGYLRRFYYELEKTEPAGTFASATVSASLLGSTKQKTITVFISDMYEQEAEISGLLQKLHRRANDVILFHLTAKNEQTLDYKTTVTFEDLETGETIQVNPAEQQRDYARRYQNWRESVQEQAEKQNITYRQLHISEPVDEALRLFLKTRLVLR